MLRESEEHRPTHLAREGFRFYRFGPVHGLKLVLRYANKQHQHLSVSQILAYVSSNMFQHPAVRLLCVKTLSSCNTTLSPQDYFMNTDTMWFSFPMFLGLLQEIQSRNDDYAAVVYDQCYANVTS